MFLDEIQSAPEALTALRYFYEKRPEIPVIAAGSLLEFSLAQVSIPVGRVDYLYMHPLNFIEFLEALGKKNLANFIAEYNFESQVPNPVHAQLLEHLRLYFRVGGMPKSVLTYLETQDIGQVSKEHSIILSTYRDDFVKYAKRGQAESIEKVFEKLPPSIGGSRTYYQKIDDHISPTRIKRSIELLEKAKILTRCTCTLARELPLKFHAKERLFKLYFVDIGLLQHALGFDWRNLPPHIELPDIARGRLAEQFVTQELLQRRSNSDLYQLHYWDRPVQGSDAEVDFIVEGEASVLPLEVKSGLKGSLAGLHSYIRKYAPKKAFVASQRNFKTMESITWILLYLVSKKLPEN